MTQIVLGSAVGYAALGNKVGRKALLVGAVFGTLPDLDVLIDFGGDIENFVFHRSFSHSLIIHLITAPLFAWFMLRFKWSRQASFRRWFVAIFAIMSTHALLDSLTVYGTQLFWPVTSFPIGISSLFIIDPFYTLPLLFSLFALCFIRNNKLLAYTINSAALLISVIYIGWSLAAKWWIDEKIEKVLVQRNFQYSQLVTTPSPFNTLLWRGIAMSSEGHYEIYASVFDKPKEVSIRFIKTENALLDDLIDETRVDQLKMFTKGFYGTYRIDDKVRVSDLRMGIEGAYVFTFDVGQFENGALVPGTYSQQSVRPPLDKIHDVIARISDPAVELSIEPVGRND